MIEEWPQNWPPPLEKNGLSASPATMHVGTLLNWNFVLIPDIRKTTDILTNPVLFFHAGYDELLIS